MNKKHILITIISSFVAIFTWGIVSVYSDQVRHGSCKRAVSVRTSLVREQEVRQPEINNDFANAIHVSNSRSSSYMDIFPDLLTVSSSHECEIIQASAHEIAPNAPNTVDMPVTLDINSVDTNSGASDEVSPEISTDKRTESNNDVQDIAVPQMDNGHNPLGFLAGWESHSDESADQVSPNVSGYQFPVSSSDEMFFYPSPGDYSMMQGVSNMGDQLFTGYEEPATGQESNDSESLSTQDQSSTETPMQVQQRTQQQRPQSSPLNSSKLALYESLRRQQESGSDNTSDGTPDLSKAAQRLVLNSMQKSHNGSAVGSEKNSDDAFLLGDPVVDNSDGNDDGDGDGVFDDSSDSATINSINDPNGDSNKSKPKEPSMFGKVKNLVKGAAGAGWKTLCSFLQANKGDASGNAGQPGANNGASSAAAQ